jgi:hypothetical protein
MVGWDPLGRCNEATLFKILELDSAVELARIMAEVMEL